MVIGTIGNATVSTVSPFGALLMLAAGGSGYESSCAAFNTYSACDEVTFSVACYKQAIGISRLPRHRCRLRRVLSWVQNMGR